MSPASRSKSKDKKTRKETVKSSSKSSGHANTGGHSPISGALHATDTAPVRSISPLYTNGRFRTIDDSDDRNGNSSGTGAEYDSVSNNGSWSGESEDPKEKAPQSQNSRMESVPGADNDKREQIRHKNERKHQRQKERRAQELHERCSGYLMSRKLEVLAQQLVSMGFSHERATMALILNEGRVEESVAWLFEAVDGKQVENDLCDGGGDSLKIDISQELARITDMEIRYKASKQEVERAVVSCEGELHKAEEILKAQKQVPPPAAPPKLDETGYPPTAASGRMPLAAMGHNATRGPRVKSTPFEPTQQKSEGRDFNYTKVSAEPTSDPGMRSTQIMLKKIPSKSEWVKPQQAPAAATEKRWPVTGPSNSSNPSVSCSPAKLEDRYLAITNELKGLKLGSLREPITVMQRPQSVAPKQASVSSLSSSPPRLVAVGGKWYPTTTTSGGDTTKPKGVAASTTALCRSISPNYVTSNYNQIHQQQFVRNHCSGGPMDLHGPTARVNGGGLCGGRGGASPVLSAASSLGLFSGFGTCSSSGSSSPVDWSTEGSSLELDYTSIDWSLDLGALPTRPHGLWAGGSYSLQRNGQGFDSFTCGVGVNTAGRRPVLSGGSGLPEGVAAAGETGGCSREWTSPFEEREIFSLSRQFVSPP